MPVEIASNRNIANPKDIDESLQEASKSYPENVQKWFKTVVKNYVIRNLDSAFVTLTFRDRYRWQQLMGEPIPKWANDALLAGKTLDLFVPEASFAKLLEDAEHAVLYLLTLQGDLSRVPFDEAVAKGVGMMRKGFRKGLEDDAKNITLLLPVSDGFRWVNLNAEALPRESQHMRHCVGWTGMTYIERVRRGETEIWSLRDSENNPHCTIEYQVPTGTVRQIRGKINRGIHPKYIKYLLELMNSSLWQNKVRDVNSYELEVNCVGITNSGIAFSYWNPPAQVATPYYGIRKNVVETEINPDFQKYPWLEFPADVQCRAFRLYHANTVRNKSTIRAQGQAEMEKCLFRHEVVIECPHISLLNCQFDISGKLKCEGREELQLAQVKSRLGYRLENFSATDFRAHITSAGVSIHARKVEIGDASNVLFDVETSHLKLGSLRDCKGVIQYQQIDAALSVRALDLLKEQNEGLELRKID